MLVILKAFIFRSGFGETLTVFLVLVKHHLGGFCLENFPPLTQFNSNEETLFWRGEGSPGCLSLKGCVDGLSAH